MNETDKDKWGGIGWNNPVGPRKGFRQPRSSKHRNQKRK